MSMLLKIFQKNQPKISPNNQMATVEDNEKLGKAEVRELLGRNYKYKPVWLRVKAKIISQIRIRRLIFKSGRMGAFDLRKDSFSTADMKKFFRNNEEKSKDGTIKELYWSFSMKARTFLFLKKT